jgi:DNA invertase Pin-like site-specific DNA recombinase
MLGVFAEFERGIIRERVNAGLARARAKGTKLGRRRVESAVEARMLELKANGDGILKIGRNSASARAWCSVFSGRIRSHLDLMRLGRFPIAFR